MNRISFNPNGKKIMESILWLAKRKPEGVNMYWIIKAVFCADIFHLKKYGRVISGDHYAAMPYGPVPSKTYDILKMIDPLALEYSGYEQYPFERNGTRIIASREANTEVFSESDIEALQHGWDIVKDLSFDQIKKLSHDHISYKKKWEDPERKTESVPMDFEDMIEDGKTKEELAHTAKFIKL